MSKLQTTRDLMKLHVGDDREIWLPVGEAIAPPDASPEQVLAA